MAVVALIGGWKRCKLCGTRQNTSLVSWFSGAGLTGSYTWWAPCMSGRCGMVTVDNWDDEDTEELWPKKEDVSVANSKQSEDRYPHRCPQCGRRAYVGLNQVEHPPGVSCDTGTR